MDSIEIGDVIFAYHNDGQQRYLVRVHRIDDDNRQISGYHGRYASWNDTGKAFLRVAAAGLFPFKDYTFEKVSNLV